MQTRKHSFVESWTNVVIGFWIAIASQMLIFPVFGIHVPVSSHFGITTFFTIISIVRSYTIRRWFNHQIVKKRGKDADHIKYVVIGLNKFKVTKRYIKLIFEDESLIQSDDHNAPLSEWEPCEEIISNDCPRRDCPGKMKEGTALEQTCRGIGDFSDSDEVCTVSAGGPGKLIPAMKCDKCGHSTT